MNETNEMMLKHDLDNRRSEEIAEAILNANADIQYIKIHDKEYWEKIRRTLRYVMLRSNVTPGKGGVIRVIC